MVEDKTESDEPKTERFNMFMSPSEMKAIDDWAWANRIRSKSEAVRRLIKMALVFESARSTFNDALHNDAKSSAVLRDIISRYVDGNDDAGKLSKDAIAMLVAVTDSQHFNNKLATAALSFMRPMNVYRGNGDSLEDAEKEAEESADFYRRMMARWDQEEDDA